MDVFDWLHKKLEERKRKRLKEALELMPDAFVEKIQERKHKTIDIVYESFTPTKKLGKQQRKRYNELMDALHNKSLLITVVADRGEGKSAYGFKQLENIMAQNPERLGYVLGFSRDLEQYLPPFIQYIDKIEHAEEGSIIVVDEAGVTFDSRASMTKERSILNDLLKISRKKRLTIIFITQGGSMMEKNALFLSNLIVFKDPALLAPEMERPALKKLLKKYVVPFFEDIRDREGFDATKKYAFFYSKFYQGGCKIPLASFWSEEISFSC